MTCQDCRPVGTRLNGCLCRDGSGFIPRAHYFRNPLCGREAFDRSAAQNYLVNRRGMIWPFFIAAKIAFRSIRPCVRSCKVAVKRPVIQDKEERDPQACGLAPMCSSCSSSRGCKGSKQPLDEVYTHVPSTLSCYSTNQIHLYAPLQRYHALVYRYLEVLSTTIPSTSRC